jgi:hypothetical protein
MLRECLLYSSMCLGVSFIAPRQLGAVERIPGRQFLPSVAWRIGQSGAPPDTVRCGFLSFFGEADRWRFKVVGAPDSPMPPSDSWLCHASCADYAADRRPGRLLAHRTVRCTTGQSGAPPDSPVIYSRTPPTKPESSQFVRASLEHRTLSGAPPDSLVHPDYAELGCSAKSFPNWSFPVSST